jgi:hypothetical protein
MGRKSHEGYSQDKVRSMDPTYLKLLEAVGWWRSKKIFDAIHQPEDKERMSNQLLEDTPLVMHQHMKHLPLKPETTHKNASN